MERIVSKLAVCSSTQLPEGQYLKLYMVFEGRDEECLLVRFKGKVFGYLNRCVHMPRRLDCEKPSIFDETGRYLRCSMHGIVYEPSSGASVSTMCEGERLRAIDVYEEDGKVGLADFRISAARIAETPQPLPAKPTHQA